MKLRGILGLSLSLTVMSIGVFPLLLPETVLAQSSCQNATKKIVKQMRNKGVPDVIINIGKDEANQGNIGNPTNRTDTISLTLSPYINGHIPIIDRHFYQSGYRIDNILKSPVLLKTWADLIVANCKNTAVVSFVLDQSDHLLQYAIQANGKTKKSECNFDYDRNPLPWNQYNCV